MAARPLQHHHFQHTNALQDAPRQRLVRARPSSPARCSLRERVLVMRRTGLQATAWLVQSVSGSHHSALLQVGIRRLLSSSAGGLFGNPQLQRPDDWGKFAAHSVARCQELVDATVVAPPSANVIHLLDELSDQLCQVYDSAEFCRNSHADEQWRSAAARTCSSLAGYLHHLNTHKGLYNALQRALDRHDRQQSSHCASVSQVAGAAPASDVPKQVQQAAAQAGSYSEEEVLVGRALLRDFEKYGVHLPDSQQGELLDLTQRCHTLSMAFGQNLVEPAQQGYVDVPANLIADDIPSSLAAPAIASSWRPGPAPGMRRFVTDKATLSSLLGWARSEDIRRQVYMAAYSQPRANCAVLEDLVSARHELARLLGSPSYVHHQVQGSTLARSPAAIAAFLHRLSAEQLPMACEDVQMLQGLKARHGGSKACLQEWDRRYYTLMAKVQKAPAGMPSVGAYFTLSRCIDGLSSILQEAMGITLIEQPLARGEAWADGIRKMAAICESGEELGQVYLDLSPREGKFGHAAHFTLRTGRCLAPGDPASKYRRPLVALVCNFAGGAHAQLSEAQLGTLFHEFGHALHSLLSRTRLQHLSGTRGPMDVVEIPSHLMEHLARDGRVLATFACHARTGEPIPQPLVTALARSRTVCAALERQQEVVDGLVDQRLFGPLPPRPGQCADAVAEVVDQHWPLKPVPGAHPHLRNGHVANYGGVYYSYLYAQALASQLWERHFASQPLSRSAGESFRTLLKHGAAKDPFSLVVDALGAGAVEASEGGWAPPLRSLLVTKT